MPRVVAAKCPWPDCLAEWTDEQHHEVLEEIGYFTYGRRGVKGSGHCPVCRKIIDVVANPGLPMIVTKYKAKLYLVE